MRDCDGGDRNSQKGFSQGYQGHYSQGKRLRKVLMSSAENIKEFITPKAKKENVSVSPMAPRVTEPYFPGKRLSDRENKYFIKFLNLKRLPWQE